MSKRQSKRSDGSKETKLYKVLFHYAQYSQATEIIEATSLEEAIEKADEMGAEDIGEFDPVHGELSVENVDLIEEEGKSHD